MVRLSCAIAVVTFALPILAQSTQPATKPSDATVPADQLLQQMLRPQNAGVRPLQPAMESSAIDRTSGSGAVSPNAPAVTVLREGTFVVDRVGRLQRSADGQFYEFVFEADGKALKDPPMIVLPNLKLAAMESAVAGSTSRELRFRITGMVTEYQQRNYILLEKVVVVQDPSGNF